jgi:hypothetical protein
MKNSTRLFGVITLVAVIMFSMAACNDGSGGSTGTSSTQTENPPSNRPDIEFMEVTTAGRLTITGLNGHGGRRIFAGRVVNNNSTYVEQTFDFSAATKFVNVYNKSTGKTSIANRELGIVTNEQVILKICLLTSNGYQNYNGNDPNVKFNVYIWIMGSDSKIEEEFAGTVTVSFSNGVGTGVFVSN